MPRIPKVSKHGTLQEDDMRSAVEVRVSQVMKDVNDKSIGHIFGVKGNLPPTNVQRVERRYLPFWKITDQKTKTDWIGLNKLSNSDKGNMKIDLVPGEYKLNINLPKSLNSNIAVNALSGVVHAFQRDHDSEAANRKLPNMYADMTVTVQANAYSIVDESRKVDTGDFAAYTVTFNVQDKDMPAFMKIHFFSHSLFKRLKITGVLWRRDFKVEAPIDTLPERGRQLIKQALSSSRFDPGVTIEKMLEEFYKEFVPEKLNQVPNVLNHFKGREDALIRTLELKYNVKFESDGKARRLAESTGREV